MMLGAEGLRWLWAIFYPANEAALFQSVKCGAVCCWPGQVWALVRLRAGGRARAPQQQQVQALSQLLTGPGVGGTLVLCTEVTIARLSHSDHHTAVTPHQHSLIPDQAAQHQGAVQDTLEK